MRGKARRHAPGSSSNVIQNHGVERLLTLAIPLEAHVRAAIRSRQLSTSRTGSSALQRNVASCHTRPQLGDVSRNLRRRGRGTLLYEARLSARRRGHRY